MKKAVYMLAAIFVLNVCVIAAANEYGLSNDPRLAAPRESFEKGLSYMAKGDKESKRRLGKAKKMYEHAEDYFLKARFLYRELGEKNGINIKHEVFTCDRMQRRAHVRVNKVRKEMRRGKRGGLF